MVKLEQTRLEDPFPVAALSGDPVAREVAGSWRQRRAEALQGLLGPLPDRVPLAFETLESLDFEGYRQDKVVFDSEETMSVPAFFLTPHARVEPGPAVLAVHGHGPGKIRVVGLDDSASPWDDYARQLALRGYVVLAPDMRCFGERADWNPPDHYGCDTNLVHACMAGVSPLTQNMWDLARALDVLEEHPLVDPKRVAVVGFSYGATLSLFVSAWDARPAATVVSGYFSSWAAAHKMPWNMCGSQVLPGMLGKIEHVDLAALVAPRPLYIESGSSDDLFPASTASDELDKVRAVYRCLGSEEDVVHTVFEGGHRWFGEGAYAFLERCLK